MLYCIVVLIPSLNFQVLHLSHSAIGRLSIGHVVNLASTDVQRFDLVYKHLLNKKQTVQYFCPPLRDLSFFTCGGYL